MRLKLGSSSLTFKSEKIRLNSKLSVKIVRKQVYERTESSFACCGFFWRYDFTFARTWMVDWWGSSFTVFLFMLSLWFAPCLISLHPSAPLGHFCRLKQKYPKVRFLVRRIWKPNFPFAGEKGKYRLPMRLQRFRLLISLFKNTNPLLSLNHTLSWFSVRES